MMSYFLGQNNFLKMILFVFIVLVFLESPTIATGKLNILAEFSGREELVQWAGYGEEKLSTVEIGGRLLCHGGGARHKSTASIHPYNPVSGATVAVFCGTSGNIKKSWVKGSTDSSGNFLIDLPSHLHAIPNLEKICHVKVVHLPKSCTCRQPFTGKHYKPIKLTSIGEGIRSYTTHDIHLMPHKHVHMKRGGT